MTSDRLLRIDALYRAALAHAPDERGAYLAEACTDDESLRLDVESLLAQPATAAGFLDTPAGAVAADLAESMPGARPSIVGQRLGSYQVLDRLGAGGMGEVYRARDTTLGREVAIKLLPPAFAADRDRLARFGREARVLAALNHPHIGAIYGLETHDGVPALVLELVPGETLADRIARGPLPVATALAYARDIADALDAAHEKGIVHRDLKPANIKVTPEGVVKVLDFGLAKATASAADDPSQLPTLTDDGTRTGVVLGTPAYMSPEQARGQRVDKRTDIWAFGCVLFEMLTGRAAFAGATLTDTLAAILEREPSWTALPRSTPAAVRRLLQRCLEKDPKRRLHDIADVRIEIDDALIAPADEAATRAAAPARRIAPVAIAALAGGAVVAALVAWVVMRSVPVAPVLPVRFAIVLPPAQPLNVYGPDRDLTLSPDGRHLVYRAGGTTNFGSPLMVRAIDRLDAQQLCSCLAFGPFFSPDSRWIGFFENAELKKVSLTGGAAITLGAVDGVPLGASWGDDDMIVFATDDPSTGLWRVSADGGKPTVLTTPDAEKRENDHVLPSVLPGARGVLFTIATAGQAENAQVAVLDLGTGQRKTLVRGGSQAEYVDPPTGSGQAGYLIYAAAGTLRAVRFDPARLEVLGDPVTVVEPVQIKPTAATNYAVSRQGTLLYVPGGVTVPMWSLVWVDRKGHEEPLNLPPRAYGPPRVSPDGTRIAFNIVSDDPRNNDIWIWDLARETMRRLTFAPGADGLPVWTPDGRRIIFMSDRAGASNLYGQAADGTGTVERLTTSANTQFPTSITADGTLLLYVEIVSSASSTPAEPSQLVLLPLASAASRPAPGPLHSSASPSRVEPSGQIAFRGGGLWSELSPDGRYLAYASTNADTLGSPNELNESGRPEVYVRPFPQVDAGRWQISTAGGTRPAWARNGRELFYIDQSNTLNVVAVQTSGSTFSAGKPAKVFEAKYAQPYPPRYYDVSPDGQRFLMVKDSAAGDPNATQASMVVVEHWSEELKARLSPK